MPGGGGDGNFDTNFEIDWGVDVKAKKTWSTPTPLTATLASPTPNLKVAPGVPVACTVTATDSDHWTQDADAGDDGDELTYQWSATGGFISGSGASVQWTPPNATGTYTITCIVDDAPKEISSIDDGTRDDAPVTVTVNLEVPPRTWSAGGSIGAVLDSKGHPVMQGGVALENGRLVAPSNQTVPKPDGATDYPTIIVRPGAELPCTVEEASDWDHWKREGVGDETDANYGTVHGDAEDEVNYTWSVGTGTFKNGHTGTGVTWVAPTTGYAPNQEYTITCTLDDKPATVSAPDLPVGDTARNDDAVTRTFKVQVVDDTSWMELSLHRDNNGTPVEDSATGTIGGKMWIAADVQVGGLSKISAPGGTVYLCVTEHDGLGLHEAADNHAWLAMPIGAGGWKTWDFDTENGGANPHWNADNVTLETTNTTGSPKRYRCWIPWDTTKLTDTSTLDPDGAGPLLPGKLLGHNASHTVELEYSVPHTDEEGHTTYEIKHEVEFQSKGQDGNYEEARKSGPNLVGTEVGNLVVRKIAGSGNPDYIKFDPVAPIGSILRNPKITFTVEDDGDHATDGVEHTYDYWIFLYKTSETEDGIDSNLAATIKGVATVNSNQSTEVTVNDPSKVGAMGTDSWQDVALTDWGPYAFDIMIQEHRSGEPAPVDIVPTMRSQLIGIPATMPGVVDEDGNPRPGHGVDGWSTLDTDFKYYASLYLNGGNSGIAQGARDASDVRIDFVNPELNTITQMTGGQKPELLVKGTPNLDLDFYTPTDGDEAGEYRGVFSVADSYASAYREHEDRRMLALNVGKNRLLAANFAFSEKDGTVLKAVDEAIPRQSFGGFPIKAKSRDKNRSYLMAVPAKDNFHAEDMAYWLQETKIFFYAGHGNLAGGGLAACLGDSLRGKRPATESTAPVNNDGKKRWISQLDLNGTQFVIWLACDTNPEEKDFGWGSIAAETSKAGASYSIGFNNEENMSEGIDVDHVHEWSQYFWKAFCIGQDITQAANYAASKFTSGNYDSDGLCCMNGYERDLQVFLSCEKQENQEAVSRSQLERV